MMNSKELRAKGWNALKGKYWTAFAVSLVTALVLGLSGNLLQSIYEMSNYSMTMDSNMVNVAVNLGINLASAATIISMLTIIFVEGPVKLGETRFYVLNTQGAPEFKEVLAAFNKEDYMNVVLVQMIKSLKLFGWSLLFLIPGIVKSYEYAAIPYILAENPQTSLNDAFAQSKAMMDGNKFRLFKLHLSFIGWLLLAILTMGIGYFFLRPYMKAAEAEFMAQLKG